MLAFIIFSIELVLERYSSATVLMFSFITTSIELVLKRHSFNTVLMLVFLTSSIELVLERYSITTVLMLVFLTSSTEFVPQGREQIEHCTEGVSAMAVDGPGKPEHGRMVVKVFAHPNHWGYDWYLPSNNWNKSWDGLERFFRFLSIPTVGRTDGNNWSPLCYDWYLPWDNWN